MKQSIREVSRFQPVIVKTLSPEEEATAIRQQKKERWAREKKQKEKNRRRKEREFDHAW